MRFSYAFLLTGLLVSSGLSGCVARTGKIGTPITESYAAELATLRVGETTVDDLKVVFAKAKPTLKEAKTVDGKKVEVWQVLKPGSMDGGAFLLTSTIAHDKDQLLLFRFTGGKLDSFESQVVGE